MRVKELLNKHSLVNVRRIGIAVPAVCEGGAGTNNVECSGRVCGNRTNRSLL